MYIQRYRIDKKMSTQVLDRSNQLGLRNHAEFLKEHNFTFVT